jgi:hypothetical protein
MPTSQIVFYGANTATTLSSGGATATIKLNGTTVDTKTVLGSGTTTGCITSSALIAGNNYTISFTGSGAPAGTFSLFVPLAYSDNTTNDNPIFNVYTVLIDSNSVTTSAPATAALPSPNPFIEVSTIQFINLATNSTLPAGITCTIAPSGGGATVDTQVTNALGQITSTHLQWAPVYQVTFSGTGAPTGTHIINPGYNGALTVVPVMNL